MRKTAIMQAIDEIKTSVGQESWIIENPKGYHPDDVGQCRIMVNCANHHIAILNKLLETEKQQIIDAYEDGYTSSPINPSGDKYYKSEFQK